MNAPRRHLQPKLSASIISDVDDGEAVLAVSGGAGAANGRSEKDSSLLPPIAQRQRLPHGFGGSENIIETRQRYGDAPA